MATAATPLVGRGAELSELASALTDDASTLVVVSGPGGIGKTRLVDEALAAVPGDPAVGRASGYVGASEVPLLPWADALRQVARTHDDDVRAAAGAVAHDLAPLIPSLPRDPGRQAGAPADLLPWFVARLVDQVPLLLVIDDAHLCDATTLEVLHRVAVQVTGPLTLVVTARPDGDPRDAGSRARWSNAIGALSRLRTTRLLELGPLDRRDAALLARSVGGTNLDATTADLVAERSEGIPFFVEQLALVSRDATAHGLALAPDARVRTDVIGARLESLDEGGRSIARAVAAMRVPVRHDELATITDLDDDALLAGIHATVDAGVVRVVDDAEPATYQLRHALLADAIDGWMLPVERRTLSRSCAEALTTRVDREGDDVPARVLAARAEHWRAAGDDRAALVATVRAASVMTGIAPTEAARQYVRASELWADVEDAEAATGTTLLGLLERSVEQAAAAGDSELALSQADRALARRPGDPSVVSRLQRLRAVHGEGVLKEADVVAAYEQAVSVLDDRGDSAELADALASYARHWMLLDRNAAALPLASEAEQTARRCGATAQAALANAVLGASSCYLGDFERGLLALRDAVADLSAAGRRYDTARTTMTLLWAEFHAGGGAHVVPRVEAELRRLESTGGPTSIAESLQAARREMLVWLGRWDAADLADDEGTDGQGLDGVDPSRPVTSVAAATGRSTTAELLLRRGDVDAAEASFAAAHAFWSDLGLAAYDSASLSRLAEMAALRGDVEESRRLLRVGLDTVEEADTWVVVAGYARAGLAAEAAAARAGRPTDDDLVARLLALLDAVESGTGAPPGSMAAAELHSGRAEACRVTGSGDDVEGWTAAAEAWAALGFPWWSGAASLRRDEALLARGHPRGLVSDSVRATLQSAERLGALQLAEDARALARRAGLDVDSRPATPPVVVPAQRGPLDALSRREVEVLELVSQGLSNRRIAEQLFISEKTASAHVSHILAKLGVANRLEAAAMLIRSG